MEAALRLHAVIVGPILARWLLRGRRERRYIFPVLRILHDEPVSGLDQRHDVVALSEKMHAFGVEGLQHLVIGRHVIGVQEGLAGDRYQHRVEKALADPIGSPVSFVLVVDPQHPLENRLEWRLSVLGSERCVPTGGHIYHPNQKSEG